MQFHPIANIFPMLPESDLAALADDIKRFGQRDEILVFQNKILDGRNRWTACQRIGVEPRTREFSGTRAEALRYVWSTNFHRRHLTSSQAGMAIAERKKIDPSFVQEVIEPIKAEAKEAQRASGGDKKSKKAKSVVGKIPQPKPKPKTRDKIAKAHGTNAKTISKCEKILEEHPEYVEDIKSGAKSVTQVEREIKKAELNDKAANLPDGIFNVIYADPPWSYNDKQGDSLSDNYGPAEKHYPSMTLSQLKDLGVPGISAENAVLFLWVTSPLLPDGLELAKSWGFKYKSAFVWDKVKHNMGHYNSVRHELLLICTKGSCTPEVPKLFNSVQRIERTDKHSEKPEEFRKIIETLYPSGRKLEMFRRGEQIEGWTIWGNESE